jgi:hypothetical protein
MNEDSKKKARTRKEGSEKEERRGERKEGRKKKVEEGGVAPLTFCCTFDAGWWRQGAAPCLMFRRVFAHS